MLDPVRLAVLRASGLLDSAAEDAFDSITQLATELLGVPVALVSLVDEQRQFFKSAVGLKEPWATRRETPLSHSFCKHVVASGEELVITDARAHPLVRENLAISELGVVAYAGVPIVASEEYSLGVLCAIDVAPRAWSERDLRILRALATSVVREIALRDKRSALAEGERQRHREQRLIVSIVDSIRDTIIATDRDGNTILANAAARRKMSHTVLSSSEAIRQTRALLPDGTVCPIDQTPNARALRGEDVDGLEFIVPGPEGVGTRRLAASASAIRDEAGEILGAVTVARDVTDAHRVQEELARSEERFRMLLQNLPNASVMLFDQDLRITVADGEQLFANVGLQRADAIGRTVPELAPLERRATIESTYRAVLAGAPTQFEVNQSGRTVIHHVCPVRDETREIVGGMTMLYDVTELREEVRMVQLLKAATLAANEAQSTSQALTEALAAVCEHLGWPLGHAYLREGDIFVPSAIWYVNHKHGDYEAFRRHTASVRFPVGVGLIGRTAARWSPVWLSSLDAESGYLRAPAAATCGLAAALMLPILVGTEVVAVLELYSTEQRAPDEHLLSSLAIIGTQLGRVVERERAHAELERHAKAVRELSMRDELTGLYNRRGFMDLGRQNLKLAARARRPAAVFFVDLNGMKAINDQRGHDQGDLALTDTARILTSAMRSSDIVARLGGDEFVVLALDADPTQLGAVRARIQAAVAAANATNGRPFHLSLSVGVALFDPSAPRTIEELVSDADRVMYQQKEARKAARLTGSSPFSM